MFRKLNLAIVILAALPCVAQKVRVGTFDRASLLVAYYKNSNPYFRKEMEALTGAEKKGAGFQELAHQQLSGEAPIDNILEALRPALAEVAHTARVDQIAGQIVYQGVGVETVDITGALVERFNPDEKTREMIRSLRAGH